MQTNLAFGQFSGAWAWRVEWVDSAGNEQFKDFHQKDLKPGEARVQADEFREKLLKENAA